MGQSGTNGGYGTLFNRGTIPDPFGTRVARIKGDRTTSDFVRQLAPMKFDAVVDLAAYTEADAHTAVELFSGKIAHCIFISTGQVYLVRAGCSWPAKESQYAGPLISAPENKVDHEEWLYGIHKRAAEDLLANAFASSRFPVTRLRIPMVNGERDHFRRIESYLWRIIDGRPILLPDGGRQICRHVYGQEVANAIYNLLDKSNTHGKVYNLSQDEELPLVELVQMLGLLLGATLNVVPISSESLAQKSLRPIDVSPFSDPWMSRLDPKLAKSDLGFKHQPLRHYLAKIVASFLASPPIDRPANYANRAMELAVAAG